MIHRIKQFIATGNYITENSNNEVFEKTLSKYENTFPNIIFNYIDEGYNKRTRLKLLIFENEKAFFNYTNYLKNKTDIKVYKKFHFAANLTDRLDIYIVLITPKNSYNYFMLENTNSMIEKLTKIEMIIHNYNFQYRLKNFV